MKLKMYVLFIILIALTLVSLIFGRYHVPLNEFISGIFGINSDAQITTLFYQIRLPRTILVILCGAALSVAGIVFQSLFRNPLVSPDVLGISSGCSLGAVIAIIYMVKSMEILQLFSFSMGIITIIFTLNMAKAMGKDRLLALIISGIITSSLASSSIMMLKYVADPYKQLPAIEFWLMGGFYNANWEQIMSVLPVFIGATAILMSIRWQLKVLTLGDEQAITLGVNVKMIRGTAIVAATSLVAAAVSIAGLVSWVGLIAPHIIKLLVGDDIIKTLPASLLSGGIILLFADVLSRSMFSAEIPISIVTSFVGAPFLAYLLWKRGRIGNEFRG